MEDILNGFDEVTDQEWREKIEKDIKGNFHDLLWQDENKLVYQPYYRKSDLLKIENLKEIQLANKVEANWKITQFFKLNPDNKDKCRDSIKKAFESGADTILLSSKLEADSVTDFIKQNLLDRSSTLLEMESSNSLLPDLDNAVILMGPISGAMRNGREINLEDSAFGIQTADFFRKNNHKIYIDGSLYKSAGSNQVQELACILQQLVEYMDFFTEKGVQAEAIANKVVLKIGIGTSFFSEIAKVRAFRYLCNKIMAAYGVQSTPAIIAESSEYYLSVTEPYNNLLRESTQVMSAAFANCDFITSPSFDLMNKTNQAFTERMARNIQIILKEESYANKVIDPASGSFYIEEMTEKLASAAWDKFLSVEKSGGLKKWYENGDLQKEIENIHDQRLENLKEGKYKMLGINIHKENETSSTFKKKTSTGVNGKYPALIERNLSESYLSKENTI